MPAVIFDLDGTLVDSRPGIFGAVNATLRAEGEPERGDEELQPHIGPPLHDTFTALLGAREDLDAVVAAYRERYADGMLAGTAVYPGIPELLDELRAAGIPLVVATAKAQSLATTLLEGLGLAGHFAAVLGPVPPSRDDKTATVARALAALGTTDAVMVGDRSHDVIGAHAHGLRAIGATWGFSSVAELRAAGADAIAHAPADVPALLGGRPGLAGA